MGSTGDDRKIAFNMQGTGLFDSPVPQQFAQWESESRWYLLTEMICPFKPCAESAHSITALSCGYPTPVLIRVVHTEPRQENERKKHSPLGWRKDISCFLFLVEKTCFYLYYFFPQEVSIRNVGFSWIEGTCRNLSFEMLSCHFMGVVIEVTSIPPFFCRATIPSLGLISNSSWWGNYCITRKQIWLRCLKGRGAKGPESQPVRLSSSI